MPIHFNHTIVHSAEREAEATFFTELFGLPPATEGGYFMVVPIADQASFDFAQADGDVAGQHYAFLVSEEDFDGIYGRIVDRGLDHWADPDRSEPGEINHHDDGCGVYFTSPSGHLLEIITRPYGGGEPV
jgi:catechol 2,3-dioxygenase-like lactoylglutathione lyase family enzyme